MEENKRISDLFERARNEAPKTSFEEATKHVIAASAAGGAGIIAKTLSPKLWRRHWAAKSFKLKAIIMIATLSTLAISGILIATQLNNKVESKPVNQKQELMQNDGAIEISSENGVEKTIVYDDNDKVLEMIVDSSGKEDSDNEVIEYNQSVGVLPFEAANVLSEEKDGVLVDYQPVSRDLEDSLVMKRYEFSDKTTKEELDAFRADAKAAGIDIDYKARIRRNELKRLHMVMSISFKGDGKKVCSRLNMYKADAFRFQTGWMENSEGVAVRFLEKDEVAPCEIKY